MAKKKATKKVTTKKPINLYEVEFETLKDLVRTRFSIQTMRDLLVRMVGDLADDYDTKIDELQRKKDSLNEISYDLDNADFSDVDDL